MLKVKEGFSLIELVIVIAIVAIVAGFMALGLGMMFAEDAESVANSINSGLTELKSESTSKADETYMHLYLHDGDYYIAYTDSATFSDFGNKGKKIGNERVQISYDGTSLAEDTAVTFEFRRKDGAFKMGPKLITCTYESDVYTVHSVLATGKHFVVNGD